uniref:Glutathione S-transferase n=2 Tax=Alexandrium monilatum TaxID=311494 RepID=A0A7S4VBD2_9DINO
MPIKLQYFDARGVAETIRLMLAVAKVDYEDARFSFSFGTPGDMSTIIRPEFDAAKAAGELTSSFGKLPYLEVDGVRMAQSKAIERYVAKEFGLGGTSALEFAHIDAICEQIRDVKEAYQSAKRGKEGAEKEAALTKWFGEDLPAHMQVIEKVVPGGPFLFGSKVCWADIAMWQFVAASDGGFFDNTEGARASFQGCPKIKAAMEATTAIPELQAWLEKRPKTSL